MSRNTLQVRLSDELQAMREYLDDKGVKVTARVREFIIQLYGLEKNKEAVNHNSL